MIFWIIGLAFLASNLHWNVAAWKDEGHVIVAAIAKKQLNESEIQCFEKPLQYFQDFPQFSSFIASAAWPDHIKYQEDFRLFNNWHFVSLIYNPENIKLAPRYSMMPYPGTGSVWALSTMFGVEIPYLLKKLNIFEHAWNYTVPPMTSGMVPKPFDPMYSKYLSEEWSPLIWNFRLRYLIHLMGDIHQPLHTCELFSSQSVHGNKGGTTWRLDRGDTDLIKEVETLHDLWDTCGGKYTRQFSGLTESFADAKAEELINKFPSAELKPEAHNSFYSAVLESFDMCDKSVYKEFKNADGSWNSQMKLPYRITQKYVDEVRYLCERQLTLAGYHLALVLKDMAHLLCQARWRGLPQTSDEFLVLYA